MRGRRAPLVGVAVCIAAGTTACAGSTPLLHPAHTLPAGNVSAGAGVVGEIAALDVDGTASPEADGVLHDFAVAPGVGPWVGGRVGLPGDNELGLTYAGRNIRLDARHAFDLSEQKIYLSIEAGGAAVVPRERGDDLGSVHGGGADVPILVGWRSDAELYSVWAGPRAGFRLLTGDIVATELSATNPPDQLLPFSGRDVWFGGLVGAKAGFRTFHVALELDVAYHLANGTFGEEGATLEVSLGQLTVSPSAALLLTF